MTSGLLTERAIERLSGQSSQFRDDVEKHLSSGIDGHSDTGIVNFPFYEEQVQEQSVTPTMLILVAKSPSGQVVVTMPVIAL